MAPSVNTTTPSFPPPSALSKVLQSSNPTSTPQSEASSHPPHLQHLAATIAHNLHHQHDWSALEIHTRSPLTSLPLPRPIISGLPPSRAYIDPDEQAEIIKVEHEQGKKIEVASEREWVLPTQIGERWSLRGLGEVFDGLDVVPPTDDDEALGEESSVGAKWRGRNRRKRVLLATLHDDSTVVYYIVHDGIVKPRQN